MHVCRHTTRKVVVDLGGEGSRRSRKRRKEGSDGRHTDARGEVSIGDRPISPPRRGVEGQRLTRPVLHSTRYNRPTALGLLIHTRKGSRLITRRRRPTGYYSNRRTASGVMNHVSEKAVGRRGIAIMLVTTHTGVIYVHARKGEESRVTNREADRIRGRTPRGRPRRIARSPRSVASRAPEPPRRRERPPGRGRSTSL